MDRSLERILFVAYVLYEAEAITEKQGLHISCCVYADDLLDSALTLLGMDEEVENVFCRDIFLDPIYDTIRPETGKMSFERFMDGVDKCLSIFEKYKNSSEYHNNK